MSNSTKDIDHSRLPTGNYDAHCRLPAKARTLKPENQYHIALLEVLQRPTSFLHTINIQRTTMFLVLHRHHLLAGIVALYVDKTQCTCRSLALGWAQTKLP